MKNKNDMKFIYGLQKLAEEFKNSEQTSDYDEINNFLEFAKKHLKSEQNIEDKIFSEVVLSLSMLRSYPLEEINKKTSLVDDLKMSKTNRRFLKVTFNSIIIKLGGYKKVGVIECELCIKVEDCVKLIKNKL